jgi:hypothetical protein
VPWFRHRRNWWLRRRLAQVSLCTWLRLYTYAWMPKHQGVEEAARMPRLRAVWASCLVVYLAQAVHLRLDAQAPGRRRAVQGAKLRT